MNVFAVIAPRDAGSLDTRVTTLFPSRYKLANGQWLVSYPASLPSDLYQTMKSQGGDISCVIFSVSSYYGYYDRAAWDFIEKSRGT